MPSTCRPSSLPEAGRSIPRRPPADRLAPLTIPEGSPTLRDIEMNYIQAVLKKHNGNKPAASKESESASRRSITRSTSFNRHEDRNRKLLPWVSRAESEQRVFVS